MIRTRLQLQYGIYQCFAFCGWHALSHAKYSIGNVVINSVKNDSINANNGISYRSYLYAADLAIWLWTILFKGASCHPYNVGSDQETTISQLAETVASTLGGSVQSSSTSTPDLNSFPSRYVSSSARARTELELTPRIESEEAVQKTADWWRSVQ